MALNSIQTSVLILADAVLKAQAIINEFEAGDGSSAKRCISELKTALSTEGVKLVCEGVADTLSQFSEDAKRATPNEKPCPNCGGTGRIFQADCPKCLGTGKIEA